MTWRVALGKAVGTSHVVSEKPCQDSCAVSIIDVGAEPILVAVVSDGAGSAEFSEIGAHLATSTFIELVEIFFEQGGRLPLLQRSDVENWLFEIRDSIEAVASSAGQKSREYACTLLGAIISAETAAFVQVGDGAIVVSHGVEDGWAYVFWPQHGEYANTTNFIISPNLEQIFDYDLAHRRINEIGVFSDGLENLVLHHATKSVHGPFFEAMIQPIRNSKAVGVDERLSTALESYLSSAIVSARTDDDTSLVLASRMIT